MDYRFQLDDPVRREAADPAVVYFDHEYWLFASKSGGYWHSPDFQHWTFVDGKNLPIEAYAPAPAIIDGQLYYTAFDTHSIFRADDPARGLWSKAGDLTNYADPALFQDDDGRVYIYYGCSANGGISVAELDPEHAFKQIGESVLCLKCDLTNRGWEVPGEDNSGVSKTKIGDSWIEGAWMTKHDGTYYLQYAAPGTQFRSYADGVFVGKSPTGPFTYAPYSPFSHKPTGFADGAGHGCTFKDAKGDWWHITTASISVRHMFERRICVYPAGFTKDGQLFCNTYLGDYPQWLPGSKADLAANHSPGWMLLSDAKKATASSTETNFPVENAFDENIRTWWCVQTGNPSEWLKVDLGKTCRINAMQINFADEGAQIHGKLHNDAYQYYVESSLDGSNWKRILDRSNNHRDMVQDYEPLQKAVRARYVRLTSVHCPAHAKFSISGFRIFGNGLGDPPAIVKTINLKRHADDGRKVDVSWSPSLGAKFYIVRYGLAPDRMYQNYQIYNATNTQINALNRGVAYYLTVDAVNANGVTRGEHGHFVAP